ncbi:MAG: 30S ribosomal protein S12 methylthiotransferase RimO [Clostridia bacterium]|nr:30S ribosomal protein S12 methylthiotransferase RimO [Clostridia bacterium]
MTKVGIISLGCPKNQVDAERMLATLDRNHYEIADCYDGVDAVIINTCGFIDVAKQEAIDNILEMAQLKEEGLVGKIIVTGCLSEVYKEEIFTEMPEVDAVAGIGAIGRIDNIIERVLKGERVCDLASKYNLPLIGERLLTTPEYWAYLKIADGCSNRCAYCAIPSIRGNYRSADFDDLIEESRQLAASGVKELILIAQDTTAYGMDLYGKLRLPELLEEICKIDGIEWIRLLYCYPDKITDELLEVMAREKKILHYIDLPLQHADDKILKAMNRHGDSALLRDVISRIRSAMPDAVIRTTMMVGFPGEGEEEFEHLAEFVNEMEFDRLGCFSFSPQEGTPAYDMEDQVDESVKVRRGEIIMQDQLEIVTLKNEERVGNIYKVLVDDYDSYSDSYSGRTYMDAPEIDGVIRFTSEKVYNPGDFVTVQVLGVNDYDLIGKEIN